MDKQQHAFNVASSTSMSLQDICAAEVDHRGNSPEPSDGKPGKEVGWLSLGSDNAVGAMIMSLSSDIITMLKNQAYFQSPRRVGFAPRTPCYCDVGRLPVRQGCPTMGVLYRPEVGHPS